MNKIPIKYLKFAQRTGGAGSYDGEVVPSTPISIGGILGLFYKQAPAYSEATNAFVIRSDQIWSFRLSGATNHNQDIPIFKQILSTFKFLN